MSLNDLNQMFSIVDPNTGKPTDYFMRLLRNRGQEALTLEEEVEVLDGELEDLTAVVATKADKATQIIAGVGLDGGGDLSADRTIDLEDTAVTPGSYTNADITVDQQGRITAAANGAATGGDVAVDDEGVEVVPAVARLNFTGAGVTVTDSGGGEVAIDIPGGGGGGGGGLTLIAEVVVTSPTALITFSGIPATYKDLRVTGLIRSNASVTFTVGRVIFNNDSGSNYVYARTNRFGNVSSSSDPFAQFSGAVPGSSSGPDSSCSFVFDLPHYTNTDLWKTFNGTDNGSDIFTAIPHYLGGSWRNTSAVNRLDFSLAAGSFDTGCAIRLWGVG